MTKELKRGSRGTKPPAAEGGEKRRGTLFGPGGRPRPRTKEGRQVEEKKRDESSSGVVLGGGGRGKIFFKEGASARGKKGKWEKGAT